MLTQAEIREQHAIAERKCADFEEVVSEIVYGFEPGNPSHQMTAIALLSSCAIASASYLLGSVGKCPNSTFIERPWRNQKTSNLPVASLCPDGAAAACWVLARDGLSANDTKRTLVGRRLPSLDDLFVFSARAYLIAIVIGTSSICSTAARCTTNRWGVFMRAIICRNTSGLLIASPRLCRTLQTRSSRLAASSQGPFSGLL
jgi:hypothetical protein